MILIEPTRDGLVVEVNHSNLYARMDGLAMALTNVPSGLTVVATTGRLAFVRTEPTVETVTTDASDLRRVSIPLLPGLESGALVGEVLRLLRENVVPPDYLAEVTAEGIVLTYPLDSGGGGRSVYFGPIRLPDRDWPSRDSCLVRPQPTRRFGDEDVHIEEDGHR